MVKRISMVLVLMLVLAASAHAGWRDKVKTYLDEGREKLSAKYGGSNRDDKTVASGLKEALTIGTRRAVAAVSKRNGYLGNPQIRIPLPDQVRRSEKLLRTVGLSKYVDEFVLTMNRAAEQAAPAARDIFVDAVKKMTITDAIRILRGNDTAATDYFRARTYDRLYTAFKPPVARTVRAVGVTRSYQTLVDRGRKLHVVRGASLDLDRHVTIKALDGLFLMLGREEKEIRENPAARVTDLLKKVFGK